MGRGLGPRRNQPPAAPLARKIGPAERLLERLFREGKISEAAERQLDLVPLNKMVMETHGISGLKCAMRSAGYEGGLARMPLLPVDEKCAAEIDALMKTLPLLEAK